MVNSLLECEHHDTPTPSRAHIRQRAAGPRRCPPAPESGTLIEPRRAAAARSVSGLLARLTGRHPLFRRILRRVRIPAKHAIVAQLSLTGLPGSERARVGRILLDLDLHDLSQRSMYFNAYRRHALRTALTSTPTGGTCLDLDAGIGFFALNLARKVGPGGKVHAFEPRAGRYDRLVSNCVLNGMDGRVITGRELLEDLEPTVDHYVKDNGIERIDLLRMEVAGNELIVLQGASECLRSGSIQNLLVTLALPARRARAVSRLLGGFGYRPSAASRLKLFSLAYQPFRLPGASTVTLRFRPGSRRR